MSRATNKRPSRTKLPSTFDGLMARHPLRPIHDDVDHDNATEIIDALATLPKRSRDKEDFLESLTTLAEAYEDENEDKYRRRASPIETLRVLMEANDMTASDLGHLLGNRSLGAAILRGDRELSKAHIRTLSDRFKVNASLFL